MIVIGMMVHVMSKVWNIDMYYGLFTSPSTATGGDAIGSTPIFGYESIKKMIYDYSVYSIPNYFSPHCQASLLSDVWHNSLRLLSFAPTGFVLLETLIYYLNSATGMRMIRYFQLESLLTWINQSQAGVHRLVFLMKEALAYNQQMQQQQRNRSQPQDLEQQLQRLRRDLRLEEGADHREPLLPHIPRRQAFPVVQPIIADPREEGIQTPETSEATSQGERSSSGPPPASIASSRPILLKNQEKKIMDQMYEVYLLFYYPFLREIVLKGFFLLILLPTILLSNQLFLQFFHDSSPLEMGTLTDKESITEDLTPNLISFRIHWVIMRSFICLFCMMKAFPFLIHPLYQSFLALHNKIRDENYLIGRKLLNINQQSQQSR